MLKSLVVLCGLLLTVPLFSQELRCNVSVSSSRVEGSNKQVFQSMQKDIYEFVNNRKWTEHIYAMDERIECNMFIQITQQVSADEFKGSIQVQLRRSVFNSGYETTLLNIKDDNFHVRYVEFQPLEFDENSNSDPLTNILAYYVYVILGFDYDSFQHQGGTEFYERAQNIVNRSQNAREKGWRAFESDYNRYWLIENLLNRSYSSFRSLMYRYHRLGLDIMADKPDVGRAEIANSLKDLQRVYRSKPDTYINRIFFDAKSDEVVNIFSKGSSDEKSRVVMILNECDPSNSGKYEKILKSGPF